MNKTKYPKIIRVPRINEETEKMLTIITIVKNAAETVSRCINSVLSQNDKNFEYIIIEGKSTDGTLEIIKNYESEFIKLHSAEDSGRSEAFNKGISLAKGKYVFWLSADDWIDSNFTTLVNQRISSEEVDFIIGKMEMFDKELKKKQSYISQNNIFLGLRNGIGVNFPGMVILKKLIEFENKLSEKYLYCNDLEWLLRLNSKKPLNYIVDNNITIYRLYGGVAERNLIKYAYEHICILYNYRYPILNLIKFYLIILIKTRVKKFLNI